jgi:tRNA pseudouridine55 synthase
MHSQLSGIIVLDKPEGISSARALAEVKKYLGADKAGHAGTLDPLATGLLICCIGAATRLARFFVQSQKTYDAVLRLGITTDSQDLTGTVVTQADVPDLTLEFVEATVARFLGPQLQEPPIYAALKHQGTPLYKLARRGQPVQKPARPVIVHAIRVLSMQLPEIRFRVTCSAGTYVRTLCAQIGQSIGCGGHMTGLRRIHCGGFSAHEALGLEELATLPLEQRRERLIPMAESLRYLPALKADAGLLAHIAQGRTLSPERLSGSNVTAGEHIKIVDDRGGLRAVLQKTPDESGYLYCCVFN